MKKLMISAAASVAIASSLFAGSTTASGNIKAYYYDTEADKAQLTGAATIGVTHKLFNNVTLNFEAMGFSNTVNDAPYLERKDTGSIFGIANVTIDYGCNTLVLGRQTLDTPMLGSFDWLLAPSHFEAYTLVNKHFQDITLVASYVKKLRANNRGSDFAKLDGDNYAFGASYSKDFDINAWYYNVDDAKYKQYYIDAGKEFYGVRLDAQYVLTDYDAGDDSKAYGIKLSGNLAGFDISLAYNDVKDKAAGMVEVDSLYTSSWITYASQKLDKSYKVEVSKEFAGINATASYADYDEGKETNLILGYDITKQLSMDLVLTSTKATDSSEAQDDVEAAITYKF